MEQMGMFASVQKMLTVSEFTRGIKSVVEGEPAFQNLWVEGEISNFTRPNSGHWYFTLKDKNAALPCVMWRSMAELQAHIPREGEHIEIHGGLGVYEPQGRYQFYVDEIRSAGEGALFQQFVELKARLEAEGLFALERKRALPAWPRRVGIVTSPTGAALRDVLNTLGRRYPLVELILAPTPVQGPLAAGQLATAIARINQYCQPELILLVRGGGSLEDLAPFNSEMLARAIVRSQAVVISGVGHETDFTIADFAADLRAPTPTAAAELATPDRTELAIGLEEMQRKLARGLSAVARQHRWAFETLTARLEQHSPAAQIERVREQLSELARRSFRALAQQTRLVRSNLGGLQARLDALNPLAVLERGYAVVSKPGGETVRAAAQVQAGEALAVRVHKGEFEVEVKKKG
jgi:exodeoxyribonuclease VII large subunit